MTDVNYELARAHASVRASEWTNNPNFSFFKPSRHKLKVSRAQRKDGYSRNLNSGIRE